MICKNCGREFLDDATYCPYCGERVDGSSSYKKSEYKGQSYADKPPTYLAEAILATIFCCLPFGVVAIVYASQVDSRWNVGDYYGAQEASDNAKRWSIASLVVGLIILIFYLLLGLGG